MMQEFNTKSREVQSTGVHGYEEYMQFQSLVMGIWQTLFIFLTSFSSHDVPLGLAHKELQAKLP